MMELTSFFQSSTFSFSPIVIRGNLRKYLQGNLSHGKLSKLSINVKIIQPVYLLKSITQFTGIIYSVFTSCTDHGQPMKPFFTEILNFFILGRQFRQISFGAFGVFSANLSAPILVLVCIQLYTNSKYLFGIEI